MPSWSKEIAALAADTELRGQRGSAARSLAEANGFEEYMNWFDNYLLEVYETKEREAGPL